MKAFPKYSEENLIPAFLKAADFRNEMLKLGFTDNGGAIHSAERILDILGQRIQYPSLSHINNYKYYEKTEFSIDAWNAYKRNEKIQIEHVSPIREFTRKAIEIVTGSENGVNNREKLLFFIKENYRLVLLTPHETISLNKINRSKMTHQRLEEAKIILVPANR